MDQARLRTALQQAFQRRQATNARYSLRAFARYLDASPAAVSEILRGKRQVSETLGRKLVDRLGVDASEWQAIFAPQPTPRAQPAYAAFDMDAYSAIAQWHYFAILSLAELPDFDGDGATVARRLNITRAKADEALERLQRLGLLVVTAEGALRWSGRHFKTSEDVADLAARRSLREGLDLARNALDRDPVDEREHTAITLAFDPEQMATAKRLIRDFRDRFAAALGQGDRRRVYRLAVQFFALSDRGRPFDA